MEPTKQQIDDLFKKLRAKRGNQSCFDCNSNAPTWASIPLGIYLCMGCSGTHRNLGVHISFVRSTVLDTWTWDQLRLMKVGGNAAALEFFKQYGGSIVESKDIQAKYTSRAAGLWKDKLKQLAEEDRKRFPTSVVVDDVVTSPTNTSQTDFFSSFEASAAPKPILGSLGANPFANASNSSITLGTPSTPSGAFGAARPLGSAGPAKPKGKGLGAMKVVNIDFAEAEAKAKAAEEAARLQLTQTPEPTTALKSPIATSFAATSTPASGPASPAPAASAAAPTASAAPVVGPGTDRLGMGMGKLSLNTAALARPAPGLSGFSNNQAQPYVPSEGMSRFQGAKSISSDQYFQRGNHVPTSEEDRARLSQFSGASAISSNAYFGRPEEPTAQSPLARGDLSAIEENAKDLARKLATQASQDISALKNLALGAASKLQTTIQDLQRNNGY